MTPEETNCFTLLDNYARTRHQSFLAEFFLSTIETDYVLCFRPIVGGEPSGTRHGCRYVYVRPDLVKTAGQENKLPDVISELLDRELPKMRKS